MQITREHGIFMIKNRLIRGIKILAAAVLIPVVMAAVAIVAVGLNDHGGNADIAIVPGNSVKSDGSPSARLQARLDVALALYRAGRVRLIFVSGGTGKEGFDEAMVMATYLSNNGVPGSSIIKDSFGLTTAATGLNAATFMRANQLKTAIVATQYFHVVRTAWLLQCNGVDVAGTAYARYVELRDLYSIPREVFACLVLLTRCG